MNERQCLTSNLIISVLVYAECIDKGNIAGQLTMRTLQYLKLNAANQVLPCKTQVNYGP